MLSRNALTLRSSTEAMNLMLSKIAAASFGQVIAILLVGWCFYSFEGGSFALYIWSFIMILFMISRYISTKKVVSCINAAMLDMAKVQKNFYHFYLNVFLTGLFWGIGLSYFILEAPDNFKLFAFGLAAFIAASGILTLATSFAAYALFVIPMVGIVAVTFLTQGSTVFLISGITSFVGMIYLLYSAFIHAKNFEAITLHTQRIEQTELDLIHALGKAAEYRDEETGNHTLRMSYACYLVSKAYGMPEDQAKRLSKAATMHDIGKIGIPDHILLKPGKLTVEEFELMKTHPNIGLSILGVSDSALIQTARIIIENHHERWDGAGYPNKLSGENIPIEGRIAAVCDVFDALISERPYKKPWPYEKALEYLLENKGTHFDPDVVDAFHACYPDVVKNAIKYSDA